MADPLKLHDGPDGRRYVKVPSDRAWVITAAIEKALGELTRDVPAWMLDRKDGETMFVIVEEK